MYYGWFLVKGPNWRTCKLLLNRPIVRRTYMNNPCRQHQPLRDICSVSINIYFQCHARIYVWVDTYLNPDCEPAVSHVKHPRSPHFAQEITKTWDRLRQPEDLRIIHFNQELTPGNHNNGVGLNHMARTSAPHWELNLRPSLQEPSG